MINYSTSKHQSCSGQDGGQSQQFGYSSRITTKTKHQNEIETYSEISKKKNQSKDSRNPDYICVRTHTLMFIGSEWLYPQFIEKVMAYETILHNPLETTSLLKMTSCELQRSTEAQQLGRGACFFQQQSRNVPEQRNSAAPHRHCQGFPVDVQSTQGSHKTSLASSLLLKEGDRETGSSNYENTFVPSRQQIPALNVHFKE